MKWFKRKRDNLIKLKEIGGHTFYKLADFQENNTERYLIYLKTITQYEQIKLRLSDLKSFAEKTIQLSKENRHKELHTHLEILNSVLQLEESNDIVFSLAANFLIIDDEPTDVISSKYYELKKRLYDSNPLVKVFFCEVSIQLRTKQKELINSLKMMDILNDKETLLAEQTFLRLIKPEGSTLIQD